LPTFQVYFDYKPPTTTLGVAVALLEQLFTQSWTPRKGIIGWKRSTRTLPSVRNSHELTRELALRVLLIILGFGGGVYVDHAQQMLDGLLRLLKACQVKAYLLAFALRRREGKYSYFKEKERNVQLAIECWSVITLKL
jgi:hypothetical protein